MTRFDNPLEEQVNYMADLYPPIVFDLTRMFAPERPWWHADLSADQQLWRWQTGPREAIVVWLIEAASWYLGRPPKDPKEALDQIEAIFTDRKADALVPLQVQARIPPELLEMVQAAGPHEAGKHIRKMERLMEGQQQAMAQLDAARQPVTVPEPPQEPLASLVQMAPVTVGG